MRIQLIQQKVPIGSQIILTLKNDEKASGLLTEIGLDYITLEIANRQKIISADAILMFDVQDQDNEDANTEPIKPDPEKVETSDVTDAKTEKTDADNIEEQASEQLDEIEKRFKKEIESANIELKPPDFTFPAEELKGWQNTDIAGKWLQIKNKYENAQKINELSTKFGRIQPLLSELTPLVKRFPNSPSLKRVFAYFNALSHPDDWQKTIQIYQEVAINSNNSKDWYNVAVSALYLNQEELACFSLGKFFQGVSMIDAPIAWYIYIDLIDKFNNQSDFREFCKKEMDDVAKDEIEILLDTAIYLFKNKVATELALETVQNKIKGEPSESLLKGVCQTLGGQSTAPYRQFLSDFMTERIISEKESDPILTDKPKSVSTTKEVVSPDEHHKDNLQMLSSDPYIRAKRADTTEKDMEKAERLYRECIERNIRYESTIKDLAMVLVRQGKFEEAQGKFEEAVDLLEMNRQKVKDKQALDNALINMYPAAGQYEKAIDLLNNTLKQPQNQERRLQIRMQIANAYIKLEDYVSAENQFHLIQKLRPHNVTVQRNLVFCLSKQGRYDEAIQLLNRIQNLSPDAKTTELLEAIERAQKTGEFILDEDTIIEVETVLSYLSGELSDFAQFFLDRCTFNGVSPERVSAEKYMGSETDFRHDIRRLVDVATELGTRRPRDRSSYYLSAARIYFDLEGNHNLFYRYLCRSFASRGDAAVSENKHLDTVREWYCEALAAYDGDKTRRKDKWNEQDAVNSLVRYLYSTLGHAHIDLTPNTRTFNRVVIDVIDSHPDKRKVFDAIAYLVLRSRFAANCVLGRLYDNETLRTLAIDYLKGMDIEVPDVMGHLSDFVQLWNDLQNRKSNTYQNISNKLWLLNNFDLTPSWLEDNIRFAEQIRSNLFCELDRQRVRELQKILETALELCKQVKFEQRDSLCSQLRRFCQDLLIGIEESPTKLSVEDIYPITEVIQDRVDIYINELYETAKPQLSIGLAVESYAPDTDQKIEVQIELENERGKSPAESLELIVQKDEGFFELTESEIKQSESLSGGEQSILTVPLRVTPEALQSQTFSLSLCAKYFALIAEQTKEQVQTQVQKISIRLYPKDEFVKIENPYAQYAEGGIVGDAEMFFGRDELIQNISQSIKESRSQSKSVAVFGQKRSGKSSVLYHLKKSLQEDKNLLILDLDNIASILGGNSEQDPDSKNSFLNQILKSVLTELQYAVEDQINEDLTHLDIPIPSDQEFYSHPNPQQCFVDIFKIFKRHISKQEDWRDVRIVLLIDEFQYIYDHIIDGNIPESFMQSWKAFLQANYFHAVLVGQDVMPKFKARFPNEFGTTQDERVTYLKQDDARRLIDEPIRIGGKQGESRYREQAIERILDLTAGSPFYIQMICNRLVEYMNFKHAGLVTEADVDQVKNDLISGVNALGLDKFDNLISSGDTSPDAIADEDVLKVLKVIADNSNKTDPCPHDKIVCQTNSPLDTILDDLEKRDVVKRRDQSYKIQVGLFIEWLIENG